MADGSWTFDAALYPWREGSWFLVTLPEDVSDEIEERHGAAAVGAAGFGSVRVEVTLGSSTWRTSLFPSAQEKAYVVPVKKSVRVAEGGDGPLDEGDVVTVIVRPLTG